MLGHEPFVCNLGVAQTDLLPRLIAHERYELSKTESRVPWQVEMICPLISYEPNEQSTLKAATT
jgi:hypothetical protein